MSEQVKNKANSIVADEILSYEGKFTIEDIVKLVQDKLDRIFETVDAIRLFIEDKVSALCEIGLVSDTGIYYYVS